MKDYFFAGGEYIRVTREVTGPGSVDPGYPRSIAANWGWGSFGANGIDAALYSGTKCYFFSGPDYIRVTRGVTGPGAVDPGYPRSIAANWGWGSFGANGIDAALSSGTKCYFFSGDRYIRVTRGETGPGTVDPGYPRPISVWGWGSFGANGIDAAFYSGPKCYFFSGGDYIRVTRGETGAGTVDPGYPRSIAANWGWGSFGANGIGAALYSGGPLAPPPAAGLGSNSNYFLSSPVAGGGCDYLTGVSVAIDVDDGIAPSNGFGFQLNAYSAQGDYDGAQQYVIYFDPAYHELVGMIDNWYSKQTQIINHATGLTTLPGNELPAGYRLVISLGNDGYGNVDSVTYTVAEQGLTVSSKTVPMLSLETASGAQVTTADLAPIVAYQLNFVGPYNAESTSLSSGGGTITYAAAQTTDVTDTEPSCVDWTYSTAETANTRYGPLPSAPDSEFAQYFGNTIEGFIIRREAEVRHVTPRGRLSLDPGT